MIIYYLILIAAILCYTATTLSIVFCLISEWAVFLSSDSAPRSSPCLVDWRPDSWQWDWRPGGGESGHCPRSTPANRRECQLQGKVIVFLLQLTWLAVLKFENVELIPTQWFFWWILRYFCFTRFPHFGHSSLISFSLRSCCSGQWWEERYFTTYNYSLYRDEERIKKQITISALVGLDWPLTLPHRWHLSTSTK